MIRASLIYIAVTLLLVIVEIIRIRIARKKGQANIDHAISTKLAFIGMLFPMLIEGYNPFLILHSISFGKYFILCFLIMISCLCVREIFWDGLLNIGRRLPINYESSTTNSWIDQHIKLSFWQKRAIGIVAWAVIAIVYYKIF